MNTNEFNIDPILWEITADGRKVPTEMSGILAARGLLTTTQKSDLYAWIKESGGLAKATEEEIVAFEQEARWIESVALADHEGRGWRAAIMQGREAIRKWRSDSISATSSREADKS